MCVLLDCYCVIFRIGEGCGFTEEELVVAIKYLKSQGLYCLLWPSMF